jgi:hypothetical protein
MGENPGDRGDRGENGVRRGDKMMDVLRTSTQARVMRYSSEVEEISF